MNEPFVLLLLAFADTHLNELTGDTARTCKLQQRGKTDGGGFFLWGGWGVAHVSFKPSVKVPMTPEGKLALQC